MKLFPAWARHEVSTGDEIHWLDESSKNQRCASVLRDLGFWFCAWKPCLCGITCLFNGTFCYLKMYSVRGPQGVQPRADPTVCLDHTPWTGVAVVSSHWTNWSCLGCSRWVSFCHGTPTISSASAVHVQPWLLVKTTLKFGYFRYPPSLRLVLGKYCTTYTDLATGAARPQCRDLSIPS